MPPVPRLTRHSWKCFSSAHSHRRNKEMECFQKKQKKCVFDSVLVYVFRSLVSKTLMSIYLK